MKYFILSVLLLVSTVVLKAQDSLPPRQSVKSSVLPRSYTYPAIRPVVVSFDLIGNSVYRIGTKTAGVGNGKTSSNSRVRVNTNIPLYFKGNLVFSASINYSHENVRMTGYQNSYGFIEEKNFSPDNFTLGISALFRSQMFSKPALFSGTILADSRNVSSIQQVRGILSASLVLKRTSQTIITAGIGGVIDPSALLPIFPSFTYWHRFNNSKWEIQTVLPVKLVLRRSAVLRGWLGMGTEMMGSRFYNQQAGQFNNDFVFNYAELWNGLTYEYRLNKFFLAGVKTGYKTPINARLNERGAKSSNYLLQGKFKSAPYASFSVSMLLPREK